MPLTTHPSGTHRPRALPACPLQAVNDDNSVVTLHPKTMETLELFRGDTVLLKVRPAGTPASSPQNTAVHGLQLQLAWGFGARLAS